MKHTNSAAKFNKRKESTVVEPYWIANQFGLGENDGGRGP